MRANPYLQCFRFALCVATCIFGCPAKTRAQCNGTWIQRMPAIAPSPRFGHEMAFDSARGVSVLFGGYDNISTYNETWEWGGGAPGASSEGSWSLRTPFFSPTPRIDHAMAYDSRRGVTVLFGGDNFDQLNNETWEWNGTNWSLMFPATVQ